MLAEKEALRLATSKKEGAVEYFLDNGGNLHPLHQPGMHTAILSLKCEHQDLSPCGTVMHSQLHHYTKGASSVLLLFKGNTKG